MCFFSHSAPLYFFLCRRKVYDGFGKYFFDYLLYLIATKPFPNHRLFASSSIFFQNKIDNSYDFEDRNDLLEGDYLIITQRK